VASNPLSRSLRKHAAIPINQGASSVTTSSSRPRSSRSTRAAAVLVGASLLVAACGGDDDESSEPAATADASSAGSTTTDPDESGPTTPTTAATTGPDATDTTVAATESADQFPVTIEHKYGEITIDADPQRVVSVGFAEHDGLLALGVMPVGVRDWYGDQPFGTWPWAQDELGDHEPELLAPTELNFEQIAALEPDLIVGISSGMTEEDYATLSAIAPTLAQPGEYVDYGTPWQEAFQITARAVGRTAEADALLADLDEKFATAREDHPEFEGSTAAVAFTFEALPGAYSSQDNRSQILIDLGFVVPPEFDELAGDAFYFSVSQEELATLDQDVIVWVVSNEAGYEAVRAEPLRPTMRAYTEGREVVADPLLSGAFSHASVLSLDFVLDELVPELALAVDGDPSTVVPSAELLN
jgi:iron complex transport system substrate-binding protein